MKTIIAFSSQKIENTQENQTAILQALEEGKWFKDIEREVVILDIHFKGHSDKTEVRVSGLSVFSHAWNTNNLDESPTEDFMMFINYEAVTTFNIGSV